MELKDLYSVVLLIVLIGVILGIGMTLLANLMTNTSLSAGAVAAINATSIALGTIGTSWMSLIVLIVVFAIIIGLIVRYFMGGGVGGR